MKDNKFKLLYYVFGLMLVVSLGIVFLTNAKIPFMMDDLWYSTKLFSEEPIRNFSDIVSAQIWHYNNWGGRAAAHTLLQMILVCGELVADILNTVMVFVTAAILVFMAETISGIKSKNSERIVEITLVIGAIHGLNANWKLSMYWEAGAANYLYISIFILIFLWCYIKELLGDDKPLRGIYIWIVPLAIVTGWSNENMGPVAFLFAVATIIFQKINKRKIRIWMLEGAVFSLTGALACILAPGNAVRGDTIVSKDYGLVWQLYLRCYYLFNGLFTYLFVPVLLIAVIFVIAKGVLKLKINSTIYFLLVAALLSWGAMILSPHYPDRASYGTMLLLLLAGLSVLKMIVKEKEDSKIYVIGFGTIIWLKGMFYLAEYLGMAFGWIR